MESDLYKDLIGNKEYFCYDLCKLLYHRRGKEIPSFNDPGEASLIDVLVKDNKCLFKRIEKPEPFCFVTFYIKYPYVSHIGIVLEDCNRFIHVLNRKLGVTIERLDSISWGRRIEGYYLYNGTE